MKHIKKFYDQMDDKKTKLAYHYIHGRNYGLYDVHCENGIAKLHANKDGILISCDRHISWDELERIKNELK